MDLLGSTQFLEIIVREFLKSPGLIINVFRPMPTSRDALTSTRTSEDESELLKSHKAFMIKGYPLRVLQ